MTIDESMELKIKAVTLASHNRFNEALNILSIVAKSYPNDFENWLNIGKLYHFMANLPDALDATQKAHSLNPLSADINNELGKIFLQMSLEDEAQGYFFKSLLLSDNNVETFLYLGHIWLDSDKLMKAYDLFATAINKFNDNPQLNNRFAIANQYIKNLPDAIFYHRQALKQLITLPPSTLPKFEKQGFNNKVFEIRLFETLALLHKGGYQAFACAGSLLGLVRENRLLPNDKDIDIGVPFELLDEIVAYLSQFGWYEYKYSYRLSNPRAMKHKDSGLILDLCGHKRDSNGKIIAGLWISDINFNDNRITEYDEFKLCEITTKYGTIWSIENPQSYLKSLYGDWQVPDSEFDTIIMAHNLRSFSPLCICYALNKLFETITKQEFTKAKRTIKCCLKHEPDDLLYLSIEQYLNNR